MQPLPKTTQNRRRQIFISYSRRDTPAVGRLYADLKRARYNLWMDTTDSGIQIGTNWRQSLEDNVHASSAVIACYSPDFFQSPFCKAEIAQALAEKKPIFPMLVRPLTPEDNERIVEFGLQDIQYGDLTREEFWQPSLQKLKRQLPSPDWLGWFFRYGGYVAAAVIAAALVILVLRVAPPSILGISSAGPTATPRNLNARMGVAVAYFELDDPDIDPMQVNPLVDRFSSDLFAAINNASEQIGLGIEFLPPMEFSPEPVRGTTSSERVGDARTKASGRGVDMVIYAHVQRVSEDLLSIYPEFTLIPEELNVAVELADGVRFGKPIDVPDQGSTTDAERQLARRAEAAAQIVAGLTQLATGEPDQFEKSLDTFTNALEAYATDEIDSVIYLLLGNSHMRLSENAWRMCDAQAIEQHVNAALTAYGQSTDLNEFYSRPFSGLSVAHYHLSRLKGYQSSGACNTLSYDLGELNTALDYIDRANQIAFQTREADPFVTAVRTANEVRVTYGLCILFLGGAIGVTQESCDRFEAAADGIVDDENNTGLYDRESSPQFLPYAAMTEALRGSVAFFAAPTTDDPQAALDAYTHAIDLLQSSTTDDSLYQQMLDYGDRAQVYWWMCRLDEAIADFDEAIRLAETIRFDNEDSRNDVIAFYSEEKGFVLDPDENGCST